MEADDLGRVALERFDLLNQSGSILWRENAPIAFPASPFNFQFRVATSLQVKPNLPPNDPGRVQASNPFARDGPEFNLGNVGPKHTLILNKFCVVRPQFVLHTNEFEPQSDFLNEEDLGAAWQVLSRLGPSYIAIYNCGVEAGSSLGHKHLQIIPRPPRESLELFPDKYKYDIDSLTFSEIPFQHAAYDLKGVTDGNSLATVYKRLCTAAELEAGSAHNVIIVHDWMLVVPRTCMRQGPITANAAAMIGIVWTISDDVYKAWIEHGPMKALVGFGKPRD